MFVFVSTCMCPCANTVVWEIFDLEIFSHNSTCAKFKRMEIFSWRIIRSANLIWDITRACAYIRTFSTSVRTLPCLFYIISSPNTASLIRKVLFPRVSSRALGSMNAQKFIFPHKFLTYGNYYRQKFPKLR